MVLVLTTSFWHVMCCIIMFVRIKYYGADKLVFDLDDGTSYFNMTDYYKGHHGIVGLYMTSLYHGSSIIYTSGFGKDVPRNDVEMLFVTIAWYLSRFFFVFILGLIIQVYKGTSSARFKYLLLENQLTEYMHQKQFPTHLKTRIQTYYEYKYQRHYFQESDILNSISDSLKQEIQMHSCRKLVESVIFFSNLPVNLLVRIISCLKREIYLVNDVIVRVNTIGTGMYFIASGMVAIYTKFGKEIHHLREGDYFGEVALLVNNSLRSASVVAIEISEIYWLDHKDFKKAINPYPDLLERICRQATERLETLNMLDEYNRIFLQKTY